MRSYIIIALAAAGWLIGATMVSAALFSTATPPAGDSLTLTSEQQQTVWNDLSGIAMSKAPASFKPATSSALPSTVEVQQIPPKTAGDVPALAPYDYAKAQGKLLIVNPRDMMIAAVISG